VSRRRDLSAALDASEVCHDAFSHTSSITCPICQLGIIVISLDVTKEIFSLIEKVSLDSIGEAAAEVDAHPTGAKH